MMLTKLQAAHCLLSNRKQTLALLEKISAEGGEPTPLQYEEFRWLAIEAAEFEAALVDADAPDVAELERLYSREDPRD